MTFFKPVGEANPYVRFVYRPQSILYQIQGQVSRSMNTETVNSKTQVNNKQSNYWAMNLKDVLYK